MPVGGLVVNLELPTLYLMPIESNTCKKSGKVQFMVQAIKPQGPFPLLRLMHASTADSCVSAGR